MIASGSLRVVIDVARMPIVRRTAAATLVWNIGTRSVAGRASRLGAEVVTEAGGTPVTLRARPEQAQRPGPQATRGKPEVFSETVADQMHR